MLGIVHTPNILLSMSLNLDLELESAKNNKKRKVKEKMGIQETASTCRLFKTSFCLQAFIYKSKDFIHFFRKSNHHELVKNW